MSKIKMPDGYYLKVTTKETGSNYNKFVILFKSAEEVFFKNQDLT